MDRRREQEIARRLRAAVERRTPDGLEELLKAVDSPPARTAREGRPRPSGRPMLRRAAVGIGSAAVAAVAAVCLLIRPAADRPFVEIPPSLEPVDSSALLEATGFVMKAYSPAPDGGEEQVLSPNQPVLLNGSAGGVGLWPSAVALGDGRSLYKIHIPFDVVCQGESLVSVTYRTNQGQFEEKLVADGESVAELAAKVRLVNRDESGSAWGYASIGREMTLSCEEQDSRLGSLSLELSFAGEENLPAHLLEATFRRMIEDTEILVTLAFADGSTGETLLQFGPGVYDGGVEATLVTGSGEEASPARSAETAS